MQSYQEKVCYGIMAIKSIQLAGGCFWCIEPIFSDLRGVVSATSGYAGGHDTLPTYKAVCSGQTGHTEVVKVDYDDEVISLSDILDLFFSFHNPTTLNRQGNDVGTQYRSAIYYSNSEDLDQITSAIERAEEIWRDPIVTEVAKDKIFYPAESYHQDYYKNNPNQGYCQFVINPKVNKLRANYSSLLKSVVVICFFFFSGYLHAQFEIDLKETGNKAFVEGVPVFGLSFHLLESGLPNDSMIYQIRKSVSYLNQEFESIVKFEINSINWSPRKALLPDIYNDFYHQDLDLIADVIADIELKGDLNIFVCNTYYQEDIEAELMGFTPILKAKEYAYEQNSPLFDRMYISYSGIREMQTLVHEMGHFLGLKHPWEMHSIDLALMGLVDSEEELNNHMTYNADASKFTKEQLERMKSFALLFRTYLCNRVEAVSNP